MKISVRTWSFSNGAWLSKSQERWTSMPMSLSTLSPLKRQRASLLHGVTEHRCLSAFWSCSLMPKYHCAIFTGVGSDLERWAAYVVPASVLICTLVRVHAPSSQREKAISPVHIGGKIASHNAQQSSIFNFYLRREMSGQGLEFIKPGINSEM